MKKALALILSLLMVLALLPAVSTAEGATATLVDSPLVNLKSGDRIVIHNTFYNKALDASGTSGYYNAGFDITPADGVLSGVTENILWDVTKNSDGTYRFSQNGKFLSMGASYASMPYDDVNKDWAIEAHGDGYSIKNIGRSVYIQWRAETYNYFSGYVGINDSGSYDFLFYKLDGVLVSEPTATPNGAGVNTPAGTEVTLACATEGATIYWKIGESGTFAAYTAPITINESCTLFAYAQVGEAVSKTVSFTYTVSDSDLVSVKQALAAPLNTELKVVAQLAYRFGNFGGLNSSSLQAKIDGEVYALQIYSDLTKDTNGNPIQLGDWLVIEGTMTEYGGVPQIAADLIRPAAEAEIIGEDATEPQVFETFAQINANYANLISEYVMIKNVTLGEYKDNGSTTVKDSTGASMPIYRAAPYPAGVEAGEVVTLYAAVSQYGSTKQFRNGTSADYVPSTNKLPPVITRMTNADAEVGKPYTFSVQVEDANGVASVEMVVNDGVGVVYDDFENVQPVDGLYTIVIPKEHITGGHLEVEVVATDAFDPPKSTTEEYEITVVDLPQIVSVSPQANSATGDNKRPAISVTFANCGETNPTVEMKLNDTAVTPVVIEGNTATYTPAADLEDGKYTVVVTITRADGKSVERNWSFTVGELDYQLYFGELHSHTAQYSDGMGTLAQAYEHAKNAPQIDFLAVTDHSNYFDNNQSNGANLGDMTDPTKGLRTADGSKTKWQEAKQTAEEYTDDSFIAIYGYEMTWSGQYGHINTFNSLGIESRNNPTYVVKDGPGLVAYYDRLVEVARIDKEHGRKTTINQFNHPGTTFGTFEDFAHYKPAYDDLITMIEVGNGEGAVRGSKYWPSYQYYTMALDKGWHLAPTNNQDNHQGGWGDSNTCRDVIITDEFSEEGIYDALREMRMYATEDNDLEIRYTLNNQVMGSVMNLEPGEKLIVNVDFTDPTDKVQKVSIIANGDVIVASKTFDAQAGSWEIELDNNYSYYYVRVDEVDQDIAVTAPVWTSETVKVGMGAVEKDTVVELLGEPITFTVPLYNYEEPRSSEDASVVDFTVTEVVYSIDGEVKETISNPTFSDNTSTLTTVKPEDNLTWIYTPSDTGRFKMEVKVTGTFRNTPYVFNGSLGFTVRDGSKMGRMLIDAGHSNFYVSGNYANSDAAFIELAAQNGIKTEHITTPITDAVLENCDLLVLTVPFKGASQSVGDSLYSDAELAAIQRYAQRGGNFIVCSKSDRLEPENEQQWASTISNGILSAIGAKARVGKGIVSDVSVNEGGNATNESYRLHFTGKDFYNWNNPLTEYMIENTNLMFSCYNAAPIILYGADSIVNAFDTSFVSSYPLYYEEGKNVTADKIYQPYYELAGDQDKISVLAYEDLPTGGFCITSGVTFFSTFEVKVEMDNWDTRQNTNYQLVVNLFKMIHPDEVTPIADIHASGKENVAYTIEGYVTSNASGYDKATAFFDCIYLQDDSGRGINVFPVAGNYQVGQKLRISGMTSSYMGEIELNCGNDYGGMIQDITLRDRAYTEDGVTTEGYATRARLLDVDITMADKQTIQMYEIDDSRLNAVLDGIAKEDRAAKVEPMTEDAEGAFLMETLTTAEAAAPEKVGNLVEFEGTVTGIERDANGVLGAIYVNDGTGSVVIFLDGYINCDDDCEKDAQGYHNLDWVVEGAYLKARGIASIGQNSYEDVSSIGPRIRLRNRADIVQAEAPIPVYGDANVDGKITAADAAMVLRALVGMSTMSPRGAVNANVAPTYDNAPNAADAAAILRYVVGLIDTFEVQNQD